jgi:hypothetical protein
MSETKLKLMFAAIFGIIIIIAVVMTLVAISSEEVPITDRRGKVVHIYVCDKYNGSCDDDAAQVFIVHEPDGG